MGVQIWVHTVTPTCSCTILIMLSMPHTIHAQVDELFTEQTISGINTLTHSVSVHLCGDKLEGVGARSNRLCATQGTANMRNLLMSHNQC
jgi:hypothetical protein